MIGIGDNRIFSGNDVADPEKFYPAISEKVIERVRVSPTGGMTSNEIRYDLSTWHNPEDKSIQTRIIQNVIHDPCTLASIRKSNPDNTVDYFV